LKNRLLRASAFWCIGVALIIGVDGLLRLGLRRVATGPLGVWNAVMDGRAGHPVLVVGSSRAEFHFDCDILARALSKPCLNVGENATAPSSQLPFIEAYLAHNRAPEIALVSLDPFALGIRRDLNDPALYMGHLDEPRLYALAVEHDPNMKRARDVPLYPFAVLGLTFTQTAIQGLFEPSPPLGLATFPLLAVDREWDGTFEAWLKEHPTGETLPVEPAAVDVLDRLLTLFERRGSQVVLVYSPDFADARVSMRNRVEVMSTFIGIAALRGLPFLDYSASPLCTQRSLFYNSQHLNARGARLFTEELARDLRRMAAAGAFDRPGAVR